MLPWHTLESNSIVNDRWLKLTADRCRLPDGKVLEPYYVFHDHDWVHVFAQAPDGRVLVVRQYRYAVGTVCVELPGGVVDRGESPLAAAQRELLEETGHTASEWKSVGRMYANPARQTNSIHIFLAHDLIQSAEQDLDESENIEFEFVSIPELHRMVERNQFSQALHTASFYRSLRALESLPDGAAQVAPPK